MYAQPFDIGFRVDTAVSGATLLQTEYFAALTFNARLRLDDNTIDAGTGIVELLRCQLTKFGYPNDKALSGHPLYKHGLASYGVYKVINSCWIKQMTEQNRMVFPDTKDSTAHHYIFAFHDSTFECIADSLKVSRSEEPYEVIFASISKRVLD